MPAPLFLNTTDFCYLLARQGPSLALWRAAEVAALREQRYQRPVLDLGCGDGLVTSMILGRVEIGLDPDRGVIERAARRGIYQHFEILPAEQLSMASGSIGTVMSNSVLEHLPGVDEVLHTVARVLCPGGRFIFTAPTEAFSAWLALPARPYAAWRNQQLGHLNLWSLECWRQRLAEVGLVVEGVRPYLKRTWVSLWDALELLQQIWIARRRVFGLFWRRLPAFIINCLGQWAAHRDLAADHPGGGRLIVARKP